MPKKITRIHWRFTVYLQGVTDLPKTMELLAGEKDYDQFAVSIDGDDIIVHCLMTNRVPFIRGRTWYVNRSEVSSSQREDFDPEEKMSYVVGWYFDVCGEGHELSSTNLSIDRSCCQCEAAKYLSRQREAPAFEEGPPMKATSTDKDAFLSRPRPPGKRR